MQCGIITIHVYTIPKLIYMYTYCLLCTYTTKDHSHLLNDLRIFFCWCFWRNQFPSFIRLIFSDLASWYLSSFFKGVYAWNLSNSTSFWYGVRSFLLRPNVRNNYEKVIPWIVHVHSVWIYLSTFAMWDHSVMCEQAVAQWVWNMQTWSLTRSNCNGKQSVHYKFI